MGLVDQAASGQEEAEPPRKLSHLYQDGQFQPRSKMPYRLQEGSTGASDLWALGTELGCLLERVS